MAWSPQSVLVPLPALVGGGPCRGLRDPRALPRANARRDHGGPLRAEPPHARGAAPPARPARGRSTPSARASARPRAARRPRPRAPAPARARARARRPRPRPRGPTAAIPFDLKTTMSSSRCASAQLAGDDLVQLVHLEPVEDAGRDRLDQVAGLAPRLLARVAADERRPLEHDVVELPRGRPVGAHRADERAGRQPVAARARGRFEVVAVTTMSCSAASAVRLAGSAPTRSQNAARRSGVRHEATTRSTDGTAARIAATCVSACPPQPMTPSARAPVPREVLRRDAARRSRAEPAEQVRLDHGRERAVLEREQEDDERAPRRRRSRSSSAPRTPSSTSTAGMTASAPSSSGRRSRGTIVTSPAAMPAERLLDDRHGVGGRQQRLDVGLGEVERHQPCGMKLICPFVSSTAQPHVARGSRCRCSRACASSSPSVIRSRAQVPGRSACRPGRESPAHRPAIGRSDGKRKVP